MYKYVLPTLLATIVGLLACGGVSGSSTQNTPGQPSGNPQPQTAEYLYVTHGTDSSISVFRVNTNTGGLSEIAGSPFASGSASTRQAVCLGGTSCDSVPRPVAADRSGRFLYVIDPDKNGVRAFTIDSTTGAIAPVSTLAFDTGTSPQDLSIDPSGRFLYVDSDSPPEVTAFAIDQNTGALRSVPGSPFVTPELPFMMTATNCCVYMSSTDQPGGVLGYRTDASSGALTSIKGSPFAAGQSTVSVAADVTGNHIIAVNDTQNAVMSFGADPTTGALNEVGLPISVGNNPVAVSVTPQGFVYVSTGQGITSYVLNGTTGVLAAVAGNRLQSGAGAIAADATGKFLFAIDTTSNSIVSFMPDSGGALTQVAASPPGTTAYVNMAVSTRQ